MPTPLDLPRQSGCRKRLFSNLPTRRAALFTEFSALAAVAVLIVASLVTISPLRVDSRRHFVTGYNAAVHGVFSENQPPIDPPPSPTSEAEPLYPAMIAAGITIIPGADDQSLNCYWEARKPCGEILSHHRLIVNGSIFALWVLSLAWGAYRLFGGVRASSLVGVIGLTAYPILSYVDYYYREPLAGVLVLLHALALLGFVEGGRAIRGKAVLVGVTAGLLPLVLSPFLYYLPIAICLVLVKLVRIDGKMLVRRWTSLASILFLLVFSFGPAALWLIRNEAYAVDSRSLQIAGKSQDVLNVRLAYNSMNRSEYFAAWLYWSFPEFGRDFRVGSYENGGAVERLIRNKEESFYRLGRHRPEQIPLRNPEARPITSILEAWPEHVATTPLFLWRGIVPYGQFEPDFGGHGILGAFWGVAGRVLSTSFLSVIVFCLVLRRGWGVVVFSVPILFLISVYAVGSHFFPRYSVPALSEFILVGGCPLGAVIGSGHVRQRFRKWSDQ